MATTPVGSLVELEKRQAAINDLDFPSVVKRSKGVLIDVDDETLEMFVRYKELRDRYKFVQDSINASKAD